MFSTTLIHKKDGAEAPSFSNYELRIMNYEFLRTLRPIRTLS